MKTIKAKDLPFNVTNPAHVELAKGYYKRMIESRFLNNFGWPMLILSFLFCILTCGGGLLLMLPYVIYRFIQNRKTKTLVESYSFNERFCYGRIEGVHSRYATSSEYKPEYIYTFKVILEDSDLMIETESYFSEHLDVLVRGKRVLVISIDGVSAHIIPY